MKLYAPSYYKDFVCIADKCHHSCCVGWEIDIDSVTLEKYKALTEGYGKEIIKTVDLCEEPHFKLSCERCPHLTDLGLCKIIIELGEGYLSDICREHPRFYNSVPRGLEVGVGLACEAAASLVLSSDGYADIIPTHGFCDNQPQKNTPTMELRHKIYAILSDRSVPYSVRLSAIYTELGVSPNIVSDTEWQEAISSLEFLRTEDGDLFSCYSSRVYDGEAYTEIFERFLAYLIYRHCTTASEFDVRASYGFALFLERLLASVSRVMCAEREEIIDIARIISEEIEYSEDNTEALKLNFY